MGNFFGKVRNSMAKHCDKKKPMHSLSSDNQALKQDAEKKMAREDDDGKTQEKPAQQQKQKQKLSCL
jgi:hypothetical protein